MKKISVTTLLTALFVLGLAAVAMAAETEIRVTGLQVFQRIVTMAGLTIAVAAFGCALAQGISIKSAVGGIARNPEASGKITVTMLIGLALIESLCIYALVVSLILLYAYPMSGPIKTLVGM